MKLSYGRLLFERGDVLHIEDSVGNLTLSAEAEHDCSKCEFRYICDTRNKDNVIAKACVDTHFELREEKNNGKF